MLSRSSCAAVLVTSLIVATVFIATGCQSRSKDGPDRVIVTVRYAELEVGPGTVSVADATINILVKRGWTKYETDRNDKSFKREVASSPLTASEKREYVVEFYAASAWPKGAPVATAKLKTGSDGMLRVKVPGKARQLGSKNDELILDVSSASLTANEVEKVTYPKGNPRVKAGPLGDMFMRHGGG